MYAEEGQHTIWRESFQQGWERQQATWYWVYGQSPQESLHQEALGPIQDAQESAYYTQYKRLL